MGVKVIPHITIFISEKFNDPNYKTNFLNVNTGN